MTCTIAIRSYITLLLALCASSPHPLCAAFDESLHDTYESTALNKLQTKFKHTRESIDLEREFENAAMNGYQSILEWLLTEPCQFFLPNQETINNAFVNAIINGHQNILEWLIIKPYGILLPNQEGINSAFMYAIMVGQCASLKWIMTNGYTLLPSDELIINMYSDLQNNFRERLERKEITDLLALFIPEEKLIEQHMIFNTNFDEDDTEELIPPLDPATIEYIEANRTLRYQQDQEYAKTLEMDQKLTEAEKKANIERNIRECFAGSAAAHATLTPLTPASLQTESFENNHQPTHEKIRQARIKKFLNPEENNS